MACFFRAFSGLCTCIVAGTMAAAAENRIDQIRPDAPELAAYGDHLVGIQTLTFTNTGQIDILNVTEDEQPVYDRSLTVEVWYPAIDSTSPGGTYTTLLRDGQTEVTLAGQAVRDAPPTSDAQFPLILISHGYPGNRMLLSHLAENLASKGYVVASIDHIDSLYSDRAAFGSTLYNRPIDQAFVLQSMSELNSPIGAITNADVTGIIGYSMGGYGSVIFGGAGVTQESTEFAWGTPAGLLERHLAGSETHEALIDPRVKAIVSIGPWGKNVGFWDPEGMAGLRKPTLFMAGSVDDVSVYEAIRSMFTESVRIDRHLLTFENANHNAAAPMPAPHESWEPVETLDFAPFEHYADAVWDTNRMNNIAQHFSTAFFDLHLKKQNSMADYLDLVPDSADGVVSLDDNGKPTEEHSYWKGFAPRTAMGLVFETRRAGE